MFFESTFDTKENVSFNAIFKISIVRNAHWEHFVSEIQFVKYTNLLICHLKASACVKLRKSLGRIH